MKTYWAVLTIFVKTIFYLIWSFLQPHRLQELKQKWAQSLMKVFNYEITVYGQAPTNENQALILVGNHISYLDILVLMATTRHIIFIAKKEVRSWPLIGFAAYRAQTIFVDRDNKENRAKVRKQIAEQLKFHQAKVVVFPSGTTTLTEELKWKKGMFEVSAESSIPIKAFALNYSPLRESAYIDDDTLVGQITKILKIKNKKVRLKWFPDEMIKDPEQSAEAIRLKVSQAMTEESF